MRNFCPWVYGSRGARGAFGSAFDSGSTVDLHDSSRLVPSKDGRFPFDVEHSVLLKRELSVAFAWLALCLLE